jgi:hypothetical protein
LVNDSQGGDQAKFVNKNPDNLFPSHPFLISAMPENHLLVQQILRVLSRIQSITEVNTRVRSAVLAKEGSK